MRAVQQAAEKADTTAGCLAAAKVFEMVAQKVEMRAAQQVEKMAAVKVDLLRRE